MTKERTKLHVMDREWLVISPFCVLATSDGYGNCDASPKGRPGRPPGPRARRHHGRHPERPGNRRADGILCEAIRWLAVLGYNQNRWHVRDVAVEILQGIRGDADAVSALEGLRMAGPRAAEWTAGNAVVGTFHPILRAGISQITKEPPMPGASPPAAS